MANVSSMYWKYTIRPAATFANTTRAEVTTWPRVTDRRMNSPNSATFSSCSTVSVRRNASRVHRVVTPVKLWTKAYRRVLYPPTA